MTRIKSELLRRETWLLGEAAQLLAWDDDHSDVDEYRVPHILANLRDAIAMGALKSALPGRVRPCDAVAWARARGDKVPRVLRRLPKPKPAARAVELSAAAKPLGTTERNTLLTIIAALCNYSDIDVRARGAAGQIAKLIDEMGAQVTDDTVRKWLNLVPDALARRKK